MLYTWNDLEQTSLKRLISLTYRRDETECLETLLESLYFSAKQLKNITQTASRLANTAREFQHTQLSLGTFLYEYNLSTQEGIALMCLAEALLRIPDKKTQNLLISDKIATADWEKHIHSGSFFVNAATWSLLLTGKIYQPLLDQKQSLGYALKSMLTRLGGTVIRPCIQQALKALNRQFVIGSTIHEALNQAKKLEAKGYRYSYDMLGEGAWTQADADTYFQAYQEAVQAMGDLPLKNSLFENPGISVKLSALHPRYELFRREQVLEEMQPRLLALAQAAKAKHLSLIIDAEESNRLDLSLEILETVLSSPSLEGWEGLGLALQAYQKRAFYVIDYLAELSRRYQRRIVVRLVKGAYWDSEIKQSQVQGLEGYPVFTRKNATDVSYLACAKKLLSLPDCFYPQFGTHNAHTVAAVMEMAGNQTDFEFQCLYGMGEALYDQIVGNIPCRIYAPVGGHKELLGYLVRRLLENGANTSFINLLADPEIPIKEIITDPIARIRTLSNKPHPKIPLPRDLYGVSRKNSKGLDLSNLEILRVLKHAMEKFSQPAWIAAPIIDGQQIDQAPSKTIQSPTYPDQTIGIVCEADAAQVKSALAIGFEATSVWSNTPASTRASYLERAADLFEADMPQWISRLCWEGGKTIPDSLGEVREAVDCCRYYAQQAREIFKPTILQGPTGELNQLTLHGRGIIACISPWNFPLAIFIGQVTAALAAGNVVMAKPAKQTPLIAAAAIQLLHEAGIPKDVLHFLPGRGEVIGHQLAADERVNGILLTGSTETAKQVQKTLSQRSGPIVPLIAETGGQNAMIVDSSALAEQVVPNVIVSAFNSAGQRCSALRILCVQEEIAPHLLGMLKGAMDQLIVGNPVWLKTDVGPVIDASALQALEEHVAEMTAHPDVNLLHQVSAKHLPEGHFFPPCVFELKDLSLLKREVFGPILHVIRFSANRLPNLLEAIVKTGYGLTLGIHSRVDKTIDTICQKMPVGNIYVNRNMIGAVVGVQPFGGERLSGTGPKAGGPHYLTHLCVERAVSINTAAVGGNANLVSLSEEMYKASFSDSNKN